MKYFKLLLIMLLILSLSGCTNFKTVKTEEIKSFSSELKNQFDGIKKVKTTIHYSGIRITVTWKEDASEEDIQQSLNIVNHFLDSEPYKERFLKEVYYKEYPTEMNKFPKVYINYINKYGNQSHLFINESISREND